MTLEQWQIALRREFGREQKYKLENLDGAAIFSDFLITNPESKRTYRVGIRGKNPGDNHCSCPDFAVNTLGTCKHIEFTLARLSRRPGGKTALAAGYHPPFSEVYLRYGADRQVIVRLGTTAGDDGEKRIAKFVDSAGVVKADALEAFDDLLTELRRGDHEVRVHDDALEFVAQCRDRKRLRRRVDELFPGGVDDPAWASLLKVPLYAYQRKGALFVARAGRALLADDMGLGKTIQSIAASELLARAVGVERVLILTPTSLKHQWKREIENFTHRSAVVIEGGPKARSAAYAADSFFKIANYETMHLDLDRVQNWSPDLVILDEAQRIKNWKTRTAQTVKKLPAQYAIVLTGTPLENRLEELHSIVEFVDRYRLGPSFRFLAEHQQLDQDGRVVGYRNLANITQTLAPVLLRRTKSEVLKDLPGRMEEHLFLPMTPEQKEMHDSNKEIVAKLVSKWRKYKYLSEADQRRLTCALQNMRMSCNSTYLLDHQTDFGTKADEIITRMDELLESPDAKVVIFSQWVRSHELLIRRLKKRHREFVLLHGGVPGHKRGDLVDRFREEADCRVFLSTDAGGVGLNLQNASAVFNMDQPWNPAVLEQRIGRVHRLGQKQPVQVLHFVARDTIEHGMLDLIRFKRSLFAGVLDGSQDEVFMGGTRLKKFMESVETATAAIDTVDSPAAAPAPVVMEPRPAAAPVVAATLPEVSVAARSPAAPEVSAPAVPVLAVPPVAPEVYAQLFSTVIGLGKSLLENLSQAAVSGVAPQRSTGPAAPFSVEVDETTGKPCLKIPMPSADLLGQANVWLQALAGVLSKKIPEVTADPSHSDSQL
jgi:superfamily II DNA or RNA helicase